MRVLGYVLEVLGVWCAFRVFGMATRPDWLEKHGTDVGKVQARKIRRRGAAVNALLAAVLFGIGLWLVRP